MSDDLNLTIKSSNSKARILTSKVNKSFEKEKYFHTQEEFFIDRIKKLSNKLGHRFVDPSRGDLDFRTGNKNEITDDYLLWFFSEFPSLQKKQVILFTKDFEGGSNDQERLDSNETNRINNANEKGEEGKKDEKVQYNEGKYYGEMEIKKEKDKNDKEKETKIRSGRGIFVSKKGDRYEGYWENDLPHVRGVLYYNDGNVYEGEFKKGKRHGKGRLFDINKNECYIFEYNGDWKNDKKHGKGEEIQLKRRKKEDNENSKQENNETNNQSNNENNNENDDEENDYVGHYVGQFKNDLFHGVGKLLMRKKFEYVGRFENGKKQGLGEETNLETNQEYKGFWKENNRNGKGRLKILGTKEYYVGSFENGQYQGYGQKTFNNGKKYKGKWKNDQRNGKGQELDPETGIRTISTWEDNHLIRSDKMIKEPYSVLYESLVPTVEGCEKVGQLIIWITGLVFTFLFFICGIIDIVNLSQWKYISTFYFTEILSAYPLLMDKFIMVFILFIMLGMFFFLGLYSKLNSEDPLFDLYSKIGRLFLIPLILGWVFTLFPMTKDEKLNIFACSIGLIFSLGSIATILVILFKGELNLFDFREWLIKRIFLSTLAFYHFYTFLGSISGLVLKNCDFIYNTSSSVDDQCLKKIVNLQIVLGLLLFAGLCVWTILFKDCVMGFYGLFVSIGLLVNGVAAEGESIKKYYQATIAFGVIGLVSCCGIILLGFLLYKKEMAWPSY